MKAIEVGQQVIGKNGHGVISKVITKSTGYVEVNYNGISKKEMAFNLTDINGVSLKTKPTSNSEAKLKEKLYVTSSEQKLITLAQREAFDDRREAAKWGSISW